MRRGTIVFLVLAAIVAAVCVRLGIWQLGRLGERRAANALVSARLDSAVVDVRALPADTALARYRRVTARGTYDFDNEIVLSGRSRAGSPGVNLLTPLRVPGSDTAVLVNRGWVYSPSARDVERERWREPAEAEITGFVATFLDPTTGATVVSEQPRTIRWLDPRTIDSLLPYPVLPFYVVATSPPAAAPGADADAPADQVPARLAPPPLDEGQHLGYAFQWFSFAAIFLGGAGVLAWKRRGGRRA